MHGDTKKKIWCQLEHDDFDASEFDETREYGLVHRREPLHNTAGQLIGGVDAESPADEIEEQELIDDE